MGLGFRSGEGGVTKLPIAGRTSGRLRKPRLQELEPLAAWSALPLGANGQVRVVQATVPGDAPWGPVHLQHPCCEGRAHDSVRVQRRMGP